MSKILERTSSNLWNLLTYLPYCLPLITGGPFLNPENERKFLKI